MRIPAKILRVASAFMLMMVALGASPARRAPINQFMKHLKLTLIAVVLVLLHSIAMVLITWAATDGSVIARSLSIQHQKLSKQRR